MNNNIPQPQHDPFAPEEGWHCYRYDCITLVPKTQVDKVISQLLDQIALLTKTDR